MKTFPDLPSDETLLELIPFNSPGTLGTTASKVGEELGCPPGRQQFHETFYKKLHEALFRLEQTGCIDRTHPRFTPRRITRRGT